MNSKYINYMNSKKASKNTIQAYTKAVYDFEQFNKSKDITKESILMWREDLVKKGLSSATINLKMNGLKSYIEFLNMIGKAKENVITKEFKVKEENKVKHYMSSEMIRNMVVVATSYRDKAIVLTYVTTGMRVSELCDIELAQYKQMKEQKVNYIVITGKGNKQRFVFFNEETQKAIDKYLETKTRSNCDKLFQSTWGNEIKRNNLGLTLKNIAKKAGIPFWQDINNHSLRSAAASIYAENGVPVADIRDLLGHASIATTNRYIKTNVANIENAVMRMKI